MTNAFDGMEKQIFTTYCAPSLNPTLKRAKRKISRFILKILPYLIKGLFQPQASIDRMNESSEQIFNHFKSMKNDRPFDRLVLESFEEFEPIVGHMTSFLIGGLGFYKIKKMLKGLPELAELDALLMDIKSNPTSQMGHAMFRLASLREIQSIASESEFLDRITQRDFSTEFLNQWDEYMHRYGDRGFKEIDVATPRTTQAPEILFQQIKSLNLADNQLLKIAERKQHALAKIRLVAEQKGKLKTFEKAVLNIEKSYGFRELPKYLLIIMSGQLHRIAKEIGEQWFAQNRLQSSDQIFDLTAAQIAQGQADPTLQLLPMITANLKPREQMQGVRAFPIVIDSRGKIIRRPLQAKDGELSGMAVSSGTVIGRAKVLRTPYEKQLNSGEILVTVATEPAWTPIFTNAAGVVLEIGGGLQHGAIIAREYGLPCVSGLEGVTDVITDGDLLEVDGDNGIVKILEKASNQTRISA